MPGFDESPADPVWPAVADWHDGAGRQEAETVDAVLLLQAAMHAFFSFLVIRHELVLLIPSSVKETKEISPVCALAAEAPFAAQQLKIQHPGGHGAQSAGLQFAWALTSVSASPLNRTKSNNTFFISIGFLIWK